MFSSPVKAGSLNLNHRVVLAPLTRLRGDANGLFPTDAIVNYYRQRATDGGLLISEAVLISPEGMFEQNHTGIWTAIQTAHWKKVVQAVHEKKGLMSIQLWHTGRVAHESYAQHPIADFRKPTVSASAVRAEGKSTSMTGEKGPYSLPRQLRTDEMERLVNDYKVAATNAKEAGFDCIELHAAHGYLLDQFLNDGVNKRTDEFGGSFENRSRLLFLILDACSTVFPYSRIAVRLSPHSSDTMKYYGTDDSDPDALYSYVIRKLDTLNLAYLLLSEPRPFMFFGKDLENAPEYEMSLVNPAKFRALYKGTMIGAGGFSPKAAESALESGFYDCVAFGRWFISNPDLPHRLMNDLPLNRYNRKTFYTHEEEGYTDYPVYDQVIDKSELINQGKIGKNLASL